MYSIYMHALVEKAIGRLALPVESEGPTVNGRINHRAILSHFLHFFFLLGLLGMHQLMLCGLLSFAGELKNHVRKEKGFEALR